MDENVKRTIRKNRMFLKYGHDCELAYDLDEVAKFIPGHTFYDRLQRFFVRLRVVSEVNRTDVYCLRSQGAIAREKRRHLANYPFIVHPFSDARKYWEMFMMFVLVMQFIMIPLDIAFFRSPLGQFQTTKNWKSTRFLFDIICCGDVCMTFVTGYYDESKKTVVLKPRTIALHYLTGYFLADVLSSIPTHFDIFMEIEFSIYVSLSLQLASVLKMLRFVTFVRYCANIANTLHMDYCNISIIMLLMCMLTYYHCLCCVRLFFHTLEMGRLTSDFPNDNYTRAASLKLLPSYKLSNYTYMHGKTYTTDQLYRNTALETYIRALYVATMIAGNAGYGFKVPQHVPTICLIVAGWIGSRVFLIYFVARISEIVKAKTSAHHKYVEMVKQLAEYMRYKQLPEYMQRRLLTYYEFRFQKSYFRESEILNTISGQLRQEIVMHSCKQLVENVAFFKNLPLALIVRIVSCLRSEVFLVNDVIVRGNTPGDSMFFIASGTVAVFTNSGREICHLEDGSHFGEVALVMRDELRIASVIAVEVCELYRLDRKDFVRAIHPYPDLLDNIQRIAADRMEKTTMLDEHNRREMASKRLY